MKEKIMLRSQAKKLEPVARIGKSGLSEGTLKEINKIISKKKLIKVRLLEASFKGKDKKELIGALAEKTRSEAIETIGNVVVLYRRN